MVNLGLVSLMEICEIVGSASSRILNIYKLERAIKEHRVITLPPLLPQPLLPYPLHPPFTLPPTPLPPLYPTPLPPTLHPTTPTPLLPYPQHPYPNPNPNLTPTSTPLPSTPQPLVPYFLLHPYPHPSTPITQSTALSLIMVSESLFTTPYQSEEGYHMTLSHLIRVKGHNTVTISSKYMSC